MNSGWKFPFDRDCLRFVLPVGLIGAIGWIWGWWLIWIPALLALIAILGFFRDPPRRGPEIPGALWSPADGRVSAITDNIDPARGPVPGKCIRIFLSVLNVHVNRAPCDGTIERIHYVRGKFLDARLEESSQVNESNWMHLNSGRHRVTVRQIAGRIARRIVCRVQPGQKVFRGQRIGLIRFGSTTEVYLPADAEIKVAVGESVRGAETVLAILQD
jgi:phosphatidylserine decarboxylase